MTPVNAVEDFGPWPAGAFDRAPDQLARQQPLVLVVDDAYDQLVAAHVAAAAGRLGYDPQISPVTQRGASDHQAFQEAGIAAANFSRRGEATPALLEPPYHSPEDTIERNISVDRLTVSMELIGCAAYGLAT